VSQATFIISRGERTEREREKGENGTREFGETSRCARWEGAEGEGDGKYLHPSSLALF